MALLAPIIPNGTCYTLTGSSFPQDDGTPYYPCNLTAISLNQHSACCASGDTCLSNGLCKYNPPPPSSPSETPTPFNAYWRVGCTDPTYQDASCPRQCRGKEGLQRHLHIVFECPGHGNWCCGTGSVAQYEDAMSVNTTCCDVKGLMFEDEKGEEGEAYTRATSLWEEQVQTMAGVFSVQGMTRSAVQTVQTGTALERGSAGVTTGGGGAQSTGTLVGAEPSKAAEGSAEGASSKTSPVALGAGLGIGIPVLILLVLGALFWYRARRRRNVRGQPTELSDDIGRKQLHGYSVEKGGREVPVELDADTGPHEVWTPQDKRTDFGQGGGTAEMYR